MKGSEKMEANSGDMKSRDIIKVLLSTGFLTVGCEGVIKIKEHTPAGEGDKYYCDCYFTDGTAIRVFDIQHIYYSVEIKEETVNSKTSWEPWDN